jgi:hypothetical protein
VDVERPFLTALPTAASAAGASSKRRHRPTLWDGRCPAVGLVRAAGRDPVPGGGRERAALLEATTVLVIALQGSEVLEGGSAVPPSQCTHGPARQAADAQGYEAAR